MQPKAGFVHASPSFLCSCLAIFLSTHANTLHGPADLAPGLLTQKYDMLGVDGDFKYYLRYLLHRTHRFKFIQRRRIKDKPISVNVSTGTWFNKILITKDCTLSGKYWFWFGEWSCASAQFWFWWIFVNLCNLFRSGRRWGWGRGSGF